MKPFLDITSFYICKDGGFSLVGKFGVDGQNFSLHIDQCMTDGNSTVSLSLFEDDGKKWWSNHDVKVNFGEYSIMSLGMTQTVQLAGLAMAGTEHKREIKSVA